MAKRRTETKPRRASAVKAARSKASGHTNKGSPRTAVAEKRANPAAKRTSEQPAAKRKRGRPRLSTETLERRGSSWAKQRVKRGTQTTERATDAAPVPAPVPLPSDAELQQIIQLIPGYDPLVGSDVYEFDCDLARKAIGFFHGKLRHVKGSTAGKPFILAPWEQAIVANLFGWVHRETGLRRYRECFIEVARKNGKTALCAGIILYLLFEDGEQGAEIYGAAFKYDQASLVWTHAAGMIRQSPDLFARCKIFKGQQKAIEVGEPGDPDYATYRPISSDSLGSHGFNIHAVVIDELHAFQTAELVDTLTTGTGSRLQPVVLYITTKDYDRISVCNEKEAYAKGVRDGTINDPTFLPVVYETPDDADWKDEKVWPLANPNLGISVTIEGLRQECRKATETPRYENTFKRLRLNMKTQQETRWLPIDTWRACVTSVEDHEHDPVVLGFDLSSNSDITARCALYPPTYDRDYFYADWQFYMPQDNIETRVRKDKVPYDVWIRDGWMTATPGNAVDYKYIRRDLYRLSERCDIKAVAFDRWGFEALRQQMIEEGMPEDIYVAFGQGYASMSPALKSIERLLLSRQLRFAENPVLLWMAQNVAIETDPAGNIKPTKAGSGERIDGVVALAMAVGVAEAQPSDYSSDSPVLVI